MTKAYAAQKQADTLTNFEIERRAVGPDDVQIDIDYCGVCHSDLHMVNNDWGISAYPLVPGHEIIGHVTAVGSAVKNFKKGECVGVGCFVDSCRSCEACEADLEQYCLNGSTMTYGSETKDPGGLTFGGYSKQIVVDKKYLLSIPENLDRAGAAPLLCAGITTYSPLKHWKVQPGQTVGVIGLGGLGHMGVKFAHAMGARTVIITTSPEKGKMGKSLGADEVLISTDEKAMSEWAGKFDFLLNTIPVAHDMNPYINLLKFDSTMCIVGAIGEFEKFQTPQLVFGRRAVAGSLIGGIKETQEMLDFCGEHNIVSEIEKISMLKINDSYIRMQKSDVKFRFVIEMKTL
ncbi:MAG: NAD(P)-dependent alcohol dehydrogenase [Candidatus Nitrohelix vancouverensis]|uniref:NAD(P)-dependent alcohol dehydrogenase n=1 Tax=Candidatus Nitrohelix vancouverensis TaxID=2705534 RepID=A0A7T0C1P2_9BACT|nr:MAG: NAD(P)-dependent alcohol dehydrogenase [Candidatus Nitrohelix vancouverensis]